MAIRAPTVRTHLSADALLGLLRSSFAGIAEHRPGQPAMPLTDALMSAFAMFSLQSPALLACDRERTEGNVQRVYGMQQVPCDTAMRERLDPVEPASLRPLFTHVFRALQRGTVLEAMVCVAGHSLFALEGTGSCAANQMHCAACVDTPHRHGSIPSRHQMLGAVRMHPDTRAVMPLMPEPIIRHDGTEKNDGARHAATRFITHLRQDPPHLKAIVTADSLRANAPHIQALHDHDLHDILGGNAGDHAYVCAHVAAAEHAGRVTYDERDDAETGLRHRCRFVSDVPRNEAHADLRVNVLECWAWDGDQVQHLSWITDLRVTKGPVYHRMRGGRARWRIANETCNTLKNQGDHFEHHDGHGYQHLSVVCALLMMLAFVVDQVQQRCCPLFQAVWATLGSKRRLWERRRALCCDDALDSMR